jgi:hypothetical protein
LPPSQVISLSRSAALNLLDWYHSDQAHSPLLLALGSLFNGMEKG